jgi:hypothetical protein
MLSCHAVDMASFCAGAVINGATGGTAVKWKQAITFLTRDSGSFLRCLESDSHSGERRYLSMGDAKKLVAWRADSL